MKLNLNDVSFQPQQEYLPAGGDYNVEIIDVQELPAETKDGKKISPRIEVSFAEVLPDGTLGTRITKETLWWVSDEELAQYPVIRNKLDSKTPLTKEEKGIQGTLERVKTFCMAIYNNEFDGETDTQQWVGRRAHIIIGKKDMPNGKSIGFLPKFNFIEPYGKNTLKYDPNYKWHNDKVEANPMDQALGQKGPDDLDALFAQPPGKAKMPWEG